MSELPRVEPVAVAFELLLQLAEVVDLAVGDDLDVAGLVQDRLLAACQIDDGQPAHAEADAGQRDAALFVRAAMVQHPHHAREIVGVTGRSRSRSTMPTMPHMSALSFGSRFPALRFTPVARDLRGNAGRDRRTPESRRRRPRRLQ